MPDRSDANQEGITLEPVSYTRMVARDVVQECMTKHMALCPLSTQRIEYRLRIVEQRWYLLCGFMVGSGILGGTAGGLLVKFFAH